MVMPPCVAAGSKHSMRVMRLLCRTKEPLPEWAYLESKRRCAWVLDLEDLRDLDGKRPCNSRVATLVKMTSSE